MGRGTSHSKRRIGICWHWRPGAGDLVPSMAGRSLSGSKDGGLSSRAIRRGCVVSFTTQALQNRLLQASACLSECHSLAPLLPGLALDFLLVNDRQLEKDLDQRDDFDFLPVESRRAVSPLGYCVHRCSRKHRMTRNQPQISNRSIRGDDRFQLHNAAHPLLECIPRICGHNPVSEPGTLDAATDADRGWQRDTLILRQHHAQYAARSRLGDAARQSRRAGSGGDRC